MPTSGWIAQTAPLASVNVPPLDAVTNEPGAEAPEDDELVAEEVVVEVVIVGAEG